MIRRLSPAFICFLLAACSAGNRMTDNPGVKEPTGAEYSLIFVIHGDAGYLYHDAGGKAVKADQRALKKAKAVGKSNSNAEVFIFHQRPVSHLLHLFPRKESRLYYFNTGKKVADEAYFSRRSESSFLAEAGLYHRYTSHKQKTGRFFLYYGHEIPDSNGEAYHASIPDAHFSIDSLALGIERFNRTGQDRTSQFDLTVLSTCSNGSPAIASRLSSQTRLLVASPEVLHLSYMDSRALLNLSGSNTAAMDSLAHHFAKNAFENLIRKVYTPVSIFLYDTELVKQALAENSESKELPGITQFYRESRFGKVAN